MRLAVVQVGAVIVYFAVQRMTGFASSLASVFGLFALTCVVLPGFVLLSFLPRVLLISARGIGGTTETIRAKWMRRIGIRQEGDRVFVEVEFQMPWGAKLGRVRTRRFPLRDSAVGPELEEILEALSDTACCRCVECHYPIGSSVTCSECGARLPEAESRNAAGPFI